MIHEKKLQMKAKIDFNKRKREVELPFYVKQDINVLRFRKPLPTELYKDMDYVVDRVCTCPLFPHIEMGTNPQTFSNTHSIVSNEVEFNEWTNKVFTKFKEQC